MNAPIPLPPIAENLWTDEPRLIGGRKANGEIIFPWSANLAEPMEQIPLSPRGTLWSWTSQEFQPKPPYQGSEPFKPYLVGYIELPGEVIVESHIVGATIDQLQLHMPMELVIIDFNGSSSTFAFRPEQSQ